jgi:hypothetical protein
VRIPTRRIINYSNVIEGSPAAICISTAPEGNELNY